MKKPIAISIIIPFYNSQKTLEKTLSSLFASSFNRPFEVIAVDDASTDNSPEIAKKYKVKLYSNNKNLGPASSRNLGAKKSQGKLLLFLDADIKLKKTTLKNLVSFYEKKKKQGKDCICGGYFEKKSLNKGFGPELNALHSYYLFSQSAIKHHSQKILPESAFPSFCGLISRKTFFKIGPFDEKYKIAGGEEHNLGFKLQRQKIPIYILLNCPVSHHFRPLFKMLKVHFQRGINFLMTKKNYPQPVTCYGINSTEALNFLFSLLSFTFLALSLLLPPLLPLSLISLLLHLFFYQRFYFQYLLADKNHLFLLKAIFAMQLLYLAKALSSATALFLIYIIKKDYFF